MGQIQNMLVRTFFAHVLTSLISRDLLFQLTQADNADVVANCDHRRNLKFSKAQPFAFTELGAIQSANVLGQAKQFRCVISQTFIAKSVTPI